LQISFVKTKLALILTYIHQAPFACEPMRNWNPQIKTFPLATYPPLEALPNGSRCQSEFHRRLYRQQAILYRPSSYIEAGNVNLATQNRQYSNLNPGILRAEEIPRLKSFWVGNPATRKDKIRLQGSCDDDLIVNFNGVP
jgi:hypothetical protein